MTQPRESAFVVLGEQGEYSDRSVWAAAVFAEEAPAQQFVDEREAAMRRAIAETEGYSAEREQRLQAIDPKAWEWGDDVPRYHIEEVPFR